MHSRIEMVVDGLEGATGGQNRYRQDPSGKVYDIRLVFDRSRFDPFIQKLIRY